MVCARCMTYNQSKYILDTLNGFTIQETDFPYVCTIMDDASTDGEPEVIRQYLQQYFDLEDNRTVRHEETDDYILTFAQHKTNKNCFFAVLLLKYNHYRNPEKKKQKLQYIAQWNENAKYLAACEGDDYWTVPYKLQMQVNYLETHPNIVLSCHRYTIKDVLTGETTLAKNPYLESRKKQDSFEFDLRYAFEGQWITKTLTILMRSCYFNPHNYNHFKYARDVHTIYFMLKNGNGVCHAFNAGVYRKNVTTSVYGNLNKIEKKRIGYNVYTEMAEVTQDPIIREVANRVSIQYCMSVLTSCGKHYVFALQIPYYFNKCIKFVKQGFRKKIAPVSS